MIATAAARTWPWFLPVVLLSLSCAAQAGLPDDPMPAYEKGDYATCATLYQRRLAILKWAPAQSRYNGACCLALAGRKDEAAHLLKLAIDSPDFRVSKVAADRDLATLHDLPEWPELARAADEKAGRGPVIGAGVDIADKRRRPASLPDGMRVRRRTEVVLLVGVSVEDRPDHIVVESSSGDPMIDNAAIAAAAGWKYQSAVADGAKYPAYVRIPFAFAP